MVNSIVSMQNEQMEKGEKIKMVTGIVIGVAADMAVGMLLKTHFPVMRGWRKMMVGLGAFVIAMKVGEDCENYFYKVWDDTKKAMDDAKKELKDLAKETPVEGTVQ